MLRYGIDNGVEFVLGRQPRRADREGQGRFNEVAGGDVDWLPKYGITREEPYRIFGVDAGNGDGAAEEEVQDRIESASLI